MYTFSHRLLRKDPWTYHAGNFLLHLASLQVKDMQTRGTYHFICNEWLDVAEGDGSIMRIIPSASPDDISDFEFLFQKFLHQQFYDGHIWLSVFTRPLRSTFTTVQRVCTCFCLLMMTMLTNMMFYRTGYHFSRLLFFQIQREEGEVLMNWNPIGKIRKSMTDTPWQLEMRE